MLLVPVDYTGCAYEVSAVAARLALGLSAELVLLYVVNAPPNSPALITEALHQDAHEKLEPLLTEMKERGISARVHVSSGEPATAILAIAKQERAEMIVMGTHGRTGLRRLWSGSVAEAVLRQSPCPVTVVRTADTGEHPGLTEAQGAALTETQG